MKECAECRTYNTQPYPIGEEKICTHIKNMNQLTDALNYDSLSHAEKITGKSYKEDDFTSSLGLFLNMENNLVRSKLLAENRDTDSWGQTIEEFLAVVEDLGFKLILEEKIEETEDRFLVYWNSGMLLALDTYRGKSVNSAKMYFNYEGDYKALERCSHGPIKDTEVRDCSFDFREGLRHKIQLLKENGKILEKWIKSPFLWLLHYQDTKMEGYDYKAINATRIAQFPQEIKDAIKGN